MAKRICSICGKEMAEGYVYDDDKYYCSRGCLHHDFTYEEWEQAYDDGEGYWTEWYDSDDESDDEPVYEYRVLVTQCISTYVSVQATCAAEAADLAEEMACNGEVTFEPSYPDFMIGDIRQAH